MPSHLGWLLPLFVPADRPERFRRATSSGADAIIIDLEDAVAPEDKAAARGNVASATGVGVDVLLRINAVGTDWHAEDLTSARLHAVTAIVVPKAERADDLEAVHRATRKPVVALIETTAALAKLSEIASAVGVVQPAFGTHDLAAELGCSPSSPLFNSVRLQLLLAARNADIAPPLDGVSLYIRDEAKLRDEAAAISANGYAGRLLIPVAIRFPASFNHVRSIT